MLITMDVQFKYRVRSWRWMVEDRLCVVSIVFPFIQYLDNVFDSADFYFLQAFDEEIFFGLAFTDLQAFTDFTATT